MATLGNDFANQAALRTEVRLRLGRPDETALLPDAQCDSLLRDALRLLNKRRPAIGVGNFQTVNGQQAYSPLPASGYAVRSCWWPGLATNCDNIFSTLVLDLERFLTQAGPINEDVAGIMLSVEPAAVQRVQRNAAWLKRQLGGTTKIFNNETIYLIPTPSASGTDVVFTWSGPRYATTFLVHERHIDGFWAAAEYEGHRRLSTGAGAVIKVQDPEAGMQIVFDPRSHARAAEAARKRFYRMFPAPTFGSPK